MSSIGSRIMSRRKELGMTQETLASKIGYSSKSSINKIENGTNDIPQSKIVKFAEALSTTTAYLMGWEQEQKNNDVIADIVMRLRTDDDFLSLVGTLNGLDEEKIRGVKQMLQAFM